MEIKEILRRPLFAHDHSHLNEENKRIGVIYITDASEAAGSKWIGEVFPYGGAGGAERSFLNHPDAVIMAKLLAAAPELLEAIMLALPYVEGAYECAFPDSDHNENVINAIKSAIKKATE